MLVKLQKDLETLHNLVEKEILQDGREIGILQSVYWKHMGKIDKQSMQSALEYHLDYLRQLVKDEDAIKSQYFLEFLEISEASFNIKDWIKVKEGILKKRSGGIYRQEKKRWRLK